MRFALALGLTLALALTLPAVAQTPVVVQGGEPGVHVVVNGVDIEGAASPASAIAVDVDEPLDVNFSIHPPEGATWEVQAVRVGVLVSGPGSAPVEAMQEETQWDSTLPPGFTVYINKTVDLAKMKRLGSGLFLLRVDVVAKDGAILYEREFYAKISGGGLLTVQGATITVLSVATGYGLLSILNDIREAYQARERHRKKMKERTKLRKALDATVGLASGEIEGAVDVAGGLNKRAEKLERRRPIAWALTGLGLGAVALSWAQFLGYAPFNATAIVILALTMGAAGLTIALLATALLKRAHTRYAEEEATVTVPVGGPEPAGARAEPSAPDVQASRKQP